MSKAKKSKKKNQLLRKARKARNVDTRPIVASIVTVTYNHKDYLEQCLDSLVCQKTNFRYQILVGDDCSTDGTSEIVRRYAAKYPNLIVPIIRPKNVGSMRNFGGLCEKAMLESDYMAFCDGDDYWTDENKLQKQYDFLQAHPGSRGCFCNARLLMQDDHYLRGYYRPSKNGEYNYPGCIPEWPKKPNNYYDLATMIDIAVPSPQAVLLKVNKSIKKVPDWFYSNKYIGDMPMFMLHLGKSGMFFMPETMCVYRKNNTSITTYSNINENFLKTRPEMIRAYTSMRAHYIKNNNSFCVVHFENRIKLEVYNYLNTLVKLNMTGKIAEFFRDNPEAGRIGLTAFLSFYNDSRKMTSVYGWEGNKTVARNPMFMHLFNPIVRTYTWFSLKNKKCKEKWKQRKEQVVAKLKSNKKFKKFVNLCRLIMFWVNCLIPKSKKRWAFTSFANYKYVDNSKYYYEYVVKNHPELKPMWFTKNPNLYKELKKRGWPVSMNNTLAGAWRMARCSIAVTDHFRMTDYDPLHGLSNRTKIVQLWHGVGLKSMGNGKDVKNTTVPGVMYSTDILSQPEDSAMTKFIKKFKYFRHAYFRELFEKYFLFVCPGQERIDMIGKMWNIPEKNYLMAGHPRNLPVYQSMSQIKNYVIYAPTYRANASDERAMVIQCLENLPIIEKTMEEFDSRFVLRLHPHTWRNYSQMIKNAISKYNRIKYDTELDIYPRINDYAVIISDYSSIAFDFLMFNKPAVFFCYDYDVFCKKDAGFNLDYMKSTPGPKTYTWAETMEEVGKYLEDPSKDAQWRRDVLKYFFDEKANGPDNSERITMEIERRLKIKK